MSLTTNLLAYWKTDESSGNAADSSGNGYTLTNVNVTYAAGKINNGAVFNNTSAKLNRADDAAFVAGANMTYSAWVNCTALKDFNTVFCARTSGGDESPWVSVNSAGNLFVRGGSGGGYTSSGTALTAGTFFMVTVVITGGNYVFYVNANGVGGGSTGSFTGSTVVFQIGTRLDDVWMNGVIDEFGVWNRALSSTEVTALYNGGAGLTYPFTTTSVKSWNSLAIASVKSINELPIASVKSINGLA